MDLVRHAAVYQNLEGVGWRAYRQIMGGKSSPGSKPSRRAKPLVDITKHIDLVEKIALSMARRLPVHADVDDMISTGAMGLIEAGERWNPKLNDSFEAFAERRIRGAILDGLRGCDVLSRDMRRQAKQMDAAAHALEGELARAPESDEIARRLGVSMDALYKRQRNTNSSVCAIDDAGPDLLEHVRDQAAADPFEEVARHEMIAKLESLIDWLPEKKRQVLALYYVEELTFAEIGRVMGVTLSRACQIHTQATAWLREMYDGDEDEEWEAAAA